MRHSWILTIFVVLFLSLAGCSMFSSPHELGWQSPYRGLSSVEEGEIFHIPTGVTVTKEQMVEMLAGARIVYVGEAHDNMNAHKVQLEILQALHDLFPGEIAVGMEMLKRPSQAVADQWTSGKLEEKEFMRTWVEDWSNDFSYYREILTYLRDNRIPLLALRASDDWMETVRNAGKAEGGKGQKEESPEVDKTEENREPLPDMDVEDVYHRSHIKAVFDKHPRGHQDFETFYRVQILWDESMAESIRQYLVSEEGLDKKMVVFAGGQHVENGFGIPRRVFRRFPASYAIVLPVTIDTPHSPIKKAKMMEVTMPEVPLAPGDFAWVISHKDLDDEKVRLGVMIQGDEDGVTILGIVKNSAAEKAGMEKEDIITRFDGESVKTSFDLTYLIGLKKPGDKGTVEVMRGEKPLTFEVTFEAGLHHMP